MYHDGLIVRRVPKWIRERTRDNMDNYNMVLSDSFSEAVRNYPKLRKDSELWKAWYYDDFRKFIPSVYQEKYLDLKAYPLKYS